MKCLIDADVLTYEIGFSSQFKDEDGELVILDFDHAAELLDQRIKEIEGECWANEPSTLYLTNDSTLNKMLNRYNKTNNLDPVEYKPNFRVDLAVSKPYKGQRKSEKPFHRDNLRAYMLDKYDTVVANGMEADDLLAVHQTLAPPLSTIICTRDKDLRMVQGMHYGWPCGAQRQFGPRQVDEIGELSMPTPTKIVGTGLKFFYSQLITGDSVDNIPGLPRGGPSLAFKLLDDAEDEQTMYERVTAKYKEKLGDDWETYFEEQVNLLHMVTELNEDGTPVLWRYNG